VYFLSDEDPMPHKAKKYPKGCRGRKDMKHEFEITRRKDMLSDYPCRWAEFKVTDGTVRKWYSCRHQKSCKKCGKIVEWQLRDHNECPEYERVQALWGWYDRMTGTYPKDIM
jgi:hypothetical protein